MKDVNSLSIKLAPTVSMHGVRLVAESRVPTFSAEETTRIPWLAGWNEPTEIESLK